MSQIVKIPYLHLWSDWTTIETSEINLDDYLYFKIENRGSSVGDWWIEGYKSDSKYPENLTGHGCYLRDIAAFYKVAKHKVKTINVLHWSSRGQNTAIDDFWKAVERG